MACSIGSVCYDQDYKEEDYDYQVDNNTFGTPLPVLDQTPRQPEEIKLEIPEIIEKSIEEGRDIDS